MRDPILTEAIKKAGNASNLARALNITPAAVSQWRRVPVLQVAKIEAITGIPATSLRPDIFSSRNGAA